MAYLLALPILGGLMLLQTAVFSRAPLLNGTADLLLLTIAAWAIRPRVTSYWFWSLVATILFGYVSALPYTVPLIAYGVATIAAVILRRRMWNILLPAYLVVVFIGTLAMNILTVITLFIWGSAPPLSDVLNLVFLPSLMINVFLGLLVYIVIGDLAERLYPEELDL